MMDEHFVYFVKEKMEFYNKDEFRSLRAII